MGNFIATLFNFKKEARLIMIGLDGAGKTTILYKLQLGESVTTVPTIGFNVETLELDNVKMTVWDIGGQDKIRVLWKHYFQNTQGVIFVIDSNDTERIPVVKEEIQRTLSDEELYNVPVLFLANKADLPNSISKNALIKHLELNKIRDRTFYVQYTNGLTGDGIYDGIKWLTAIIKSK